MNLIDRAKNILLQPKSEWAVIDEEQTSIAELYREYIIPLAAIPQLAGIVGLSVVGIGMPTMGVYRVPLGASVTNALISYVLSLVTVYIVALIIEVLAANFGGERNRLQALKVSTYASTAGWVGGILLIHPVLGLFSLLASLYGIYLLYLGLPVLMKTSREKAAPYTAVVAVVAFIVLIVFSGFSSMFMPGMSVH